MEMDCFVDSGNPIKGPAWASTVLSSQSNGSVKCSKVLSIAPRKFTEGNCVLVSSSGE